MKKFLTLLSAVLVTAVTLNLAWVQAQSQDVTLEYRLVPGTSAALRTGDEVEFEIVLKNPDHQKIISVRSWLEYSPAHVEGLAVDTKDSLFTLSAPGEDGFDAESGWVKVGRSNISGGVSDPEVVVATVKFKVKTASGVTTSIKPYDYQVSELGHVSVNIIDQGFPVNVLAREPEALELRLNSGASAESVGGGLAFLPPIGGPSFPALLSPTDLKANTGSGLVDLTWQAPLDLNRSGFNVYYGKTSGQYSRRHSVSGTNTRIQSLPNGETYFFAVNAVNSVGAESDYSQEVGVIVGEPLSSTAPFPGLLQATLGRLPNQPQNGPLTWWLLASAVGLSGTLLFRTKRQPQF